MSVNWEAIGAIGEITGAGAVVVSLIYLGAQVRKSTQATRAATFQGFSEQASDFWRSLSENGELASIWARGRDTPETLSELELQRYYHQMIRHVNLYENIFTQKRQGTTEPEIWRIASSSIRYLVRRHEQFPQWWEQHRHFYRRAFQEEMRRALEEEGRAGSR